MNKNTNFMIKVKSIVTIVLLSVALLSGGIILLVKNPDTFSISERRTLSKKPSASVENIWSGEFMTDFENFALDQFSFRDTLRGIKAWSEYYVFHKSDNNGIFIRESYLSKIEYPRVEAMQDYALNKFEGIYCKFLEPAGISPYLVVIPDKNYYLTKDSDILHLDYDELYSYLYENTPYMEKIDIRDLLDISDYYYTDTHWRQDKIIDVADRIVSTINSEAGVQFSGNDKKKLDLPFNGVYVGQYALNIEPDEISYIDNEIIAGCSVTSFDTGKAQPMSMYDYKKASGNDAYEFFLSGANALIEIENENAINDRELIIFRDSFGSSIAPLMVENYRKITLVDIRYIQSGMLGAFIEFDDQDVLFMYSTTLLNNSLGLK